MEERVIRIEFEGMEVWYIMTAQEQLEMRDKMQAVVDEWCRRKCMPFILEQARLIGEALQGAAA